MFTKSRLINIKPAVWVGIICMILVVAPRLQCADVKNREDCGCHRLNNKYDSIYIEFVRAGLSSQESKTELFIWLRLRNNTSCPVALLVTGYHYRLIDGKPTINVLDGEEIQVHFEFQTGNIREYYERRDNFGDVRLLPNYSTVFRVPSSYFKKKRFICVPIRYDWEVGDIWHEVRFKTTALPRGWEKTTSAPANELK